jgi:hypothetical protein
LLLCRQAGVPHVEVHVELATALEYIDERDRTVTADEGDSRIDLDHRESAAGCGDCVPFSRERLLTDPELVHLGLPARPVCEGRKSGCSIAPSCLL